MLEPYTKCATAAILALATAAGAQQATSLRGTVKDVTGAVVPGADVVVERDGAVVVHLKTAADGSFSFPGAPREYTVTVREPGFFVLRSSPVPFGADSTTTFTLQVASTSGPVVELHPVTPMPVAASVAAGTLRGDSAVEVTANRPLEVGALVEGGTGLDDRSDFKFLSAGVRAGKVLTGTVGPGPLRGNFEYGVEVFPFWQSYTPKFLRVKCPVGPGAAPGTYTCSGLYTVGGTYTGITITPIQLRWNMPHGRWMPWVQGAGGLLWTNHKYPAIGNTNVFDLASNGPSGDTSVWNFTPQFGIGTHYFVGDRRSVNLGINAVHISSASLGDKNPGVNVSLQFTAGYSWWK